MFIDEKVSEDETIGDIEEKYFRGQCIWDGTKLVTEDEWVKENSENE